MHQFDTILLTDPRYENPNNPDQYSQNIINEDAYVQNALEKLGVKCHRTSWDNPDIDWSTTRSILFRTTWDYMDRFEEFSQWFEIVNKQTMMINPYETIKWNLDKHYLKDLEQAGVRIPATIFIGKGQSKTLTEWLIESGWSDAILKPAISGGARHTYRINPENVTQYEDIFAGLIASESFLLQKFQKSIMSKGEISLMMINGEFTHAILKKAKEGEFRVQDDFGGSVHDYQASPAEIDFAHKAISACQQVPSYARVDIIWNDQDELCLGELELIEPEMWFRNNPHSATLLAEHIQVILDQS